MNRDMNRHLNRLLVVSRNAALAIGLTLADYDVVDVRPGKLAEHDHVLTPVDAVVLDLEDPTTSAAALQDLGELAPGKPTLLVANSQPGWSEAVAGATGDVMLLPSPVSRQTLLSALEQLMAPPPVAPAPVRPAPAPEPSRNLPSWRWRSPLRSPLRSPSRSPSRRRSPSRSPPPPPLSRPGRPRR